MFYKSWSQKGINYILDLLNANGDSFLSYDDFVCKYNININFLNYYGTTSAIKAYFLDCKIESQTTKSENIVEKFKKAKKPSKFVYSSLIEKKQTQPTISQSKWLNDLNIKNQIEVNWKEVYSLPFKATIETKLTNFQYKFIHRRIATNSFLHKIGKSPSDKCTFCDLETKSLLHLFWECKFIQTFWKELESWLSTKLQTPIACSKLNCLGIKKIDQDNSNTFYHILLLGKYFIYLCKLKSVLPKMSALKNKLQQVQSMEKQIGHAESLSKN